MLARLESGPHRARSRRPRPPRHPAPARSVPADPQARRSLRTRRPLHLLQPGGRLRQEGHRLPEPQVTDVAGAGLIPRVCAAQAGRPDARRGSHSGHGDGGAGSQRRQPGPEPRPRSRQSRQPRGMWPASAPSPSVGRSDLRARRAAAGKGGARTADHAAEVDVSLNPVGNGSDASDTDSHGDLISLNLSFFLRKRGCR